MKLSIDDTKHRAAYLRQSRLLYNHSNRMVSILGKVELIDVEIITGVANYYDNYRYGTVGIGLRSVYYEEHTTCVLVVSDN